MEEIEISSRLYVEDGAYFMTATLPAQSDGDDPVMSPVTFVLAGNRLVTSAITSRVPSRPFRRAPRRWRPAAPAARPILIGLLEAIVDRLADILERASRGVEAISHDIFQPRCDQKSSKRDRDFQRVLEGHRPQGRR